jgi:hypothetical protein
MVVRCLLELASPSNRVRIQGLEPVFCSTSYYKRFAKSIDLGRNRSSERFSLDTRITAL